MRQGGFWDFEEQLARLTKGGDPLVKLASVVDFEPFRYRLEKALKRSDGAKGGNYGDSALNYCTLGVTVRISVKGASSPDIILLRCTLRN